MPQEKRRKARAKSCLQGILSWVTASCEWDCGRTEKGKDPDVTRKEGRGASHVRIRPQASRKKYREVKSCR